MKDVFRYLGFRIDDLKQISERGFLSIPVKEAFLLDVRPDYELSRLFDVDNSIYCQYKEIEFRHKELPRVMNVNLTPHCLVFVGENNLPWQKPVCMEGDEYIIT